MKVLLVGFSKQNAVALEYLIGKRHQHYKVVDMAFSFNDKLQLCLPNIPTDHKDANAIIVNINGVGLAHTLSEQLKELQAFIGNRVALLVVQVSRELQKKISDIQNHLTFFIDFPYSKEGMEQALDKLFFSVPLLTKETTKEKTVALPPTPVSPKTTPSFSQKITQSLNANVGFSKIDGNKSKMPTSTPNKPPKENQSLHFLHRLIDAYFPVPEISLLHRFADMLVKECPLELTIGTQTIYIHRFKNLALITNYNRLMEFCAIANDFEVFADAIKIKAIDIDDFEKVINAPYTPYKKYPLNTMLWEMGHRMLPKVIEIPNHPLRLKMRFMPNFLSANETPEYLRVLTSVCLLAPRSLDELTLKMEGIADKMAINRLFLLAILSGAADMEILEKSMTENEKHISSRIQNQGVIKAKETGFLKRFLNKLGF